MPILRYDVDPHYAQTLGLRLRSGRLFDAARSEDAGNSVVTFAVFSPAPLDDTDAAVKAARRAFQEGLCTTLSQGLVPDIVCNLFFSNAIANVDLEWGPPAFACDIPVVYQVHCEPAP